MIREDLESDEAEPGGFPPITLHDASLTGHVDAAPQKVKFCAMIHAIEPNALGWGRVMYEEASSGRKAESSDATAAMIAELDRHASLLGEQAATIAHYKKMYDRSSKLAKIGVWECDLATEALTWTDGVYDLFELPRGSPIARAQVLEYYDDASRHEMERLRAAAIAEGGGFALDIHIRTAKGNERWIRLTADVEQEDGRSVRIFGTKQDISLEKAAEEEVRALQIELLHLSRRSAMGAMAATLAHELNQPLAAIGNYVAGTRRALRAPEPSGQMLESGLDAIEKCALRAGNIIRSMRAMTNGSAIIRHRLDPNPIIREAVALAMIGVDDDVALHFDLADGVMLSVDAVQIQQVLINLIRNAVDAMEGSPRKELRITTALARDAFEMRVEDSGHGIRPEMADRLFESFVSSKADGMGIGLSVSRTIVEAHEGQIVAANRETGGACFCVTLPLILDD